MSDVITLSGFGQPHDALRDIAPDALHLDYAVHDALPPVYAMLEPHANARAVIGWSMGGQLAVRAIAEGVLKPERLVLLGTPFHFLREPGSTLGMPQDIFAQYRSNFLANPERTLNKSYALIAHRDTQAEILQEKLTSARARLQPRPWATWLDTLTTYSCRDVDFSCFPPTLLIHGDQDVVIYPDQSHAFQSAMPGANLLMLQGCGHAPHWHDAKRVRAAIEEHIA